MAIEDFGQKIGGAKKDLWKSRGLMIDDLAEMNAAEREKYIKKDNIWPKPDYEKMLNEEGYDRAALFFIKTMRDSIPAQPVFRISDTEEVRAEKQESYIEFIRNFKEDLLNIKTKNDISKMGYDYLKKNGYVEDLGYHCRVPEDKEVFMNSKLIKNIQASPSTVLNDAIKKGFLGNQAKAIKDEFIVLQIAGNVSVDKSGITGNDRITVTNGWARNFFYTTDKTMGKDQLTNGNFVVLHQNSVLCGAKSREAADAFVDMIINKMLDIKQEKESEEVGSGDRKKKLVPKPLEHIQRIPDDRFLMQDIEGQDFINDFKIRGGEFGNWVNETERQQNMNFAYDSFKDIALAIGIRDEDIALGGRLNIAFGARGHGAALAHYEPLREVINLTRMKGAGALAHEYFHAMDDIAGKTLGFKTLATNCRPRIAVPKTNGYVAYRDGENAFTKLVDAMKYKEVNDEEAIRAKYEKKINEAEQKHEKLKKQLEEYIKRHLPDSKLTPEQIDKRDALIEKILTTPAELDRNNKLHSKEYDELNKLNKEVTGYVFSADAKKTIPNWQYFVNDYKANAEYWKEQMNEEIKKGEPVRVETDFYKNARELDKLYSKDSSGYWAENHEMAARAFACYMHDKLEEHGIKNDYLTGHAFFDSMTYPSKEERQEINKAIDNVIEYMKDLEIIRDRDKEIDIHDISIEQGHVSATLTIDGVDNKVNFYDGELFIDDGENLPNYHYINRHQEELYQSINDAADNKTKDKGIDR